MSWVADGLIASIITWFAGVIVGGLNLLWDLLAASVFTSPDVTVLPQVRSFSATSLGIVNTCYVLAFLAVFGLIMGRDTIQTRYGPGELIPRLVIGLIAANFAPPLCSTIIGLANAVTAAVTAESFASPWPVQQLRSITSGGLAGQTANTPASFLMLLICLIIAIQVGILLMQWIVRLGVLIIAVGIAPIALALHGTPQTEPAAKLWWRTFLGTLGVVVLQAVAMHTTFKIFLDPAANLPALGIPGDPGTVFNLLVVLCLLWGVIKIPGMMRRYVTKSSPSQAGMILRVVLIQQLTKGLSRVFSGSRGAARFGRATGRGAGRGGDRPWPVTSPKGGGRPAGPRTPRPSAPMNVPSRPPTGAGPGVVGVAYPTGRPVKPYTADELAAGVDAFGKTVPRQSPPAPPSSSRPPVRAAGVVSDPPQTGSRATIPARVTPATAMPQTRPLRPPARGPWNRPIR